MFLEIILAPTTSEKALNILTQKQNIRLIQVPIDEDSRVYEKLAPRVKGGLLVQDEDREQVDGRFKSRNQGKPTEENWKNCCSLGKPSNT